MLFGEYVAGKSDRGRSSSGGELDDRPVKRQCVMQDAKTSKEEFFRVLEKGVLDKDFIRFSQNMLGGEITPPVLFVRPCYRELLAQMLEIVDDPKKYHAVVVMGTPGTGKTVCGLYATHHLLNEKNATVLYSLGVDRAIGEGNMYLMGPADSKVLQAARTNGFVLPEPMGKWVGRVVFDELAGKRLVDFLLNQKELYFVVDPPKSGINVDALTACKKLVFSSPHRLNANSLKNDSYMRFMPVWTFEELQQAQDAGGLVLSDEELDERFKIFGGIARHVLDSDYERPLEFFAQHIGSLTADEGANVLDPYSNNKDAASLFVHIQTQSPFVEATVSVSSERVRKYINLQVQLSKNRKMSEWATGLSRAGFKASAGTILEQCWHSALALDQRPIPGCTIRELGVDQSVMSVTVPKFDHLAQTFPDNNMNGLAVLRENQYCLPLTSNFETFDAFAGIRAPFCCPDNIGLCLVGFQMTVDKAGHVLKNAGGQRVKAKFEELFRGELGGGKLDLGSMFVVFVTTADVAAEPAWRHKQKWVTKGNTETRVMDQVRQFVLVLPDKQFDQVNSCDQC
jgi:hypothetical protein